MRTDLQIGKIKILCFFFYSLSSVFGVNERCLSKTFWNQRNNFRQNPNIDDEECYLRNLMN